MYPKELKAPITSKLHTDKQGNILPRKSMLELVNQNQMSLFELALADFLTKIAIPFVYGFTLPNFENPARPFTLDFYFPTKDTGLEIDSIYHDKPEVKKRDRIKTETARLIITHLKRYRKDIPEDLMYYNFKGQKREDIRQIYETWKKGKIIEAVEPILNFPDVELKTPEIMKDQTLFDTLELNQRLNALKSRK